MIAQLARYSDRQRRAAASQWLQALDDAEVRVAVAASDLEAAREEALAAEDEVNRLRLAAAILNGADASATQTFEALV